MPTICSIPGCRTNRSKNDVTASVFSFPKDPKKRGLWEWAIQRYYDPNYVFQEGHKICCRHFEDEMVEKEHRAVRDDGSLLVLPRKAWNLVDYAVPTIFDFLPDCLPESIVRRRIPITSLDTLVSTIDQNLKDELVGLNITYNPELPAVSIYRTEINEDLEPYIKFSITLNKDLVAVVRHSTATEEEITEILGGMNVCDDWIKLRLLLRAINSSQPPSKKRKRDKSSDTNVLVLEVSDNGLVKLGELGSDDSDCDDSDD